MKNLTILQLAEKIVDATSDNSFSEESINEAMPYMRRLGKRLDISPMQALFMSIMIDNFSSELNVEEIAQHFNCRRIRVLSHWKDIEVLEKKEYIMINRKGKMNMGMPFPVIEAFRDNRKYNPIDYSALTTANWFEELSNLLSFKDGGDMSYKSFVSNLSKLLCSNEQLPVVRQIKSYFPHVDMHDSADFDDLILLLGTTDLFVQNGDNHIGLYDIEDLYENRRQARRVANRLKREDNILQRAGVIELCDIDGQVDSEAWKLTDKAKKELLSELNINEKKCNNGILLAENITPKKMFYKEDVERQIARLRQLLDKDNFLSVQQRLIAKGMRSGFSCILRRSGNRQDRNGSAGSPTDGQGYQDGGHTKHAFQMGRRNRKKY